MRRTVLAMHVARAGFTLVEALVALVVVALGAAGATALHARALRASREAAHLSDAVQLGSGLVARMVANRGVAGDEEDNPYLHFDTGDGAVAPAAACFDADCSPSALAAFDLAETAAEVAARLPGGRLVACRDGAVADPATGFPGWACSGGPGASIVVKVGWRDGGIAVPRFVLPVGEFR